MDSKYLYTFFKDSTFRTVCIFCVIGVIVCLVLIRLCISTSLALKDIHDKQALIARIPALEAEIGRTQVIVNKGITLTLNGIILDANHPMAVINNTLVKFEDVIDGQRVVTITSHSTTLCDVALNNKCITLYLE